MLISNGLMGFLFAIAILLIAGIIRKKKEKKLKKLLDLRKEKHKKDSFF